MSNSEAPVTGDQVRVTYLGTTMLLIEDEKTSFFIDAFLTPIPLRAFLPGMSVSTDTETVDQALQRTGTPRADSIFVSHSHHDHVFDAAYLAQKTGATLRGSESTLWVGRGGGLPESQMEPHHPGLPVQVGDFVVTVLESRHSPRPVGGHKTPITQPLRQPSSPWCYREGGSYDFLIERRGRRILAKSSANFLPRALDQAQADVLFLSTATLGKQSNRFKRRFYEATVTKVSPKLVIPTHWNDIWSPVSDRMQLMPKFADNAPAGLDFLIKRLKADRIAIAFLQGFGSIMPFASQTLGNRALR